ncbi:MAG: SAM-dependent chlorinase/fluorinase [Bacteroidetes bacterium]|nr:SAM-dependent chlorinase/fluorinase [Bacteroidota bacterium]MCZ6899709.1 SAM-dependent chlorinase/fluorinase [Bacteroidota bacterium]
MKRNGILVLMTDFGMTDRFVASMKGVALGVDENLRIFDLTHNITPYNVLEGSQVLAGTIPYWPDQTVFVAVVDPGVGTDRKSVAIKTKTGHYVVAPDNGLLTLPIDQLGITEVREIDPEVNRRKGSADSYTFDGRDLYIFTGARLASGKIKFPQVGPKLAEPLIEIPIQKPTITKNSIRGQILKAERPFGNLVTNIPCALIEELGITIEDNKEFLVDIYHGGLKVYEKKLPYARSFALVGKKKALIYPDSIQMIGLAVNGGNFATINGIEAGAKWTITIKV